MPDYIEPTFRDEVRRFLSHALTESLRTAGRNTIGVYSDIAACRVWHRRLFEQGWIAPAWPQAHGGTGWSAMQRLYFERACAANDAPVLFAGGLRSLGPLLIERGTPEQRARYLPAILDGRDLWCQGFSETGAGSDLAQLKTRARRDGGDYIVDGAKIWTTGAQVANRMFALVRTTTEAKPQNGITFLLVDMGSPGISVRPLQTLSGEPEFNEVFFDDVRIPVSERVGEENEGWAVAKALMRLARSNNTTSGLLRCAFRRACHEESGGAPLFATKLAALACRLDVFEAMELRTLSLAGVDGVSDVEASLLKVTATELHQDITTLVLERAAYRALVEPDALVSAKYFATRAASIYSGTNETHRNLIARHCLDL